MNNWEEIGHAMWDAILDWVKTQDKNGVTYQKIAEILGIKNRSLVGEWINGNKKAEKTSFALMMTYLERAGLDYRDFFPDRGTQTTVSPTPAAQDGQRIAELEAQVKELEAQVRALEVYKYKWEGHLESMRAQGSGFTTPIEKKRSA